MTELSPFTPGYPSVGEVIDGKYQIERMLGEGGMGAVARAIHLVLRAPVALKFMNPQFVLFPGAVDRFLNEGVASRSIHSEHVVQVDDVGKLPSGAPYLVMDCLEGMDLAELLRAEGAPGLPIARSVHFVLQILRGLQAAHAAGIVHRDMKPSNCFVVAHEGEQDFVKILDFGISKVQAPGAASLTQTNSALGTPLYMSPEQARSPRDVDARSDLYSVGVILYELLSGTTPFFSEAGEFTEILFKLFTTDAPRIEEKRPDVPAELAAAVHHALAREPQERFASARDLADALAPFADARSATLLQRIRTFSPRRSQLPSGEIPPSAIAFSALETRQSRRSSAPDEAVSPTAPEVEHISALPAAFSAQATPLEAIASTQLDLAIPRPAPLPSGVRTDLGASREIAPSSGAPEKKRSAGVMIATAAGVLVVLGGGGAFAVHAARSHDVVTPAASVDAPLASSAPARRASADLAVEPPPRASASASASAASSTSAPPRPRTPRSHPPASTSATPPHYDPLNNTLQQ